MFVGEPRIKWTREQYGAYRKRKIVGWAGLFLSLIFALLASYVPSNLPVEIRTLFAEIAAVTSLVSLGISAYLLNRGMEYYLPESEDRLVCFLKPAVDSLMAYETKGKARDMKKALKSLEKLAERLEHIRAGNLDFIKNGPIGQTLSEVKKNFRGGLIPALKSAEIEKVQQIRIFIDNMEKNLEMSKISEDTLGRWGDVLTTCYPSGQPPKPFWRRLPAKRSHLPLLLMVIAIPLAYAAIGILLQLPIQFIYTGVGPVFGATLGFAVYLLSSRSRNA